MFDIVSPKASVMAKWQSLLSQVYNWSIYSLLNIEFII